jgi:trehalose 6-phosphate synthase/phosphatase
VMIAYAGRTNGAYILESEASLVYDYRNSDPEYGEIQSLELYEQLRRVVKVCGAMLTRTICLTNC